LRKLGGPARSAAARRCRFLRGGTAPPGREADDDDDRGEDHEPEPRPVVEERPCAQAGRWRCRRRSVSGAREGAESFTGCRQSPRRQTSPLSCLTVKKVYKFFNNYGINMKYDHLRM